MNHYMKFCKCGRVSFTKQCNFLVLSNKDTKKMGRINSVTMFT